MATQAAVDRSSLTIAEFTGRHPAEVLFPGGWVTVSPGDRLGVSAHVAQHLAATDPGRWTLH